MSVLQKLTEGVQHRDMQAEGAALLNKWEATGLLEGLNDGHQKQGMAVLLENQAKELLREASSMAAGDVEGFAAVAFPIVRRVFGGLIAQDLISVQPMSLPSGLIFFLDFTHEDGRGTMAQGESLYGGGVVGRQIVDGVAANFQETGFYGLGTGRAAAITVSALAGAGTMNNKMTTRATTDAVDRDNEDFDPDIEGKERIVLRSLALAANAVQIDPGVPQASLPVPANTSATDRTQDVCRAINLTNGRIAYLFHASAGATNGTAGPSVAADDLEAIVLKPARRLAKFTTATSATTGLKEVTGYDRFVYEELSSGVFAQSVDVEATAAQLGATSAAGTQASLDEVDAELAARQIQAVIDNTTLPVAGTRQAAVTLTSANVESLFDGGDDTMRIQGPSRDQLGTGTGLGAIAGADTWALEEPKPGTGNAGSEVGKDSIAEIDIKVDSVAVTAQTKKLKAKWSPELGQDLNAYHNLDAEVELTGILSEQIALEIDRELLGELVRGATAGTRYWSRAPGLFVDSNGQPLGATSAAPDFTGTVSEWYETLIETINDVSAQIHRKTLRGGANFVVCSPEVANILEFTSGFRASVTADQDRGTIGAVRAGSLSKKFDVYVDPYFLRNVILVGRKGSSFLESGYVYAPYVPLQVTPTIFGTEDFVPRKGVMTRYAKKMVRPDMYGLVICRGLLGEEMPN